MTSILLICSLDACVLFNLRSMNLYVLLLFTSQLGKELELLDEPFFMATLIWKPLFVKHVYKTCEIEVTG